jgi:Protein of unknown function (DUF3551)
VSESRVGAAHGRQYGFPRDGRQFAKFNAEGDMRNTFLGLAGIAASLFFVVSPASADSNKWCAITSGGMGASNCGNATREQCETSVRPEGGFCEENQFYTGSTAAEKRVKPKTKRNPG